MAKAVQGRLRRVRALVSMQPMTPGPPVADRHPGWTRPWLESTVRLDTLPRLGWSNEPTPVLEMPTLAADLGLDWLGTKRDDLTSPLWGGAKTRKLDYLLAAPPWGQAPAWASVGAIGSGQMVALTAASQQLGRDVEAFLFWEPLSAGVVDSLAYVASHARAIHYHHSRTSLALRRPGLLLARRYRDMAVVPPTMPLFSRMTTSFAPKSWAVMAAVIAAPPEPSTTTSASRFQF